MKLIDILVQELPKHGGWPDGVKVVEQDSNGSLIEMESGYCSDFRLQLADDWLPETLTREEYESALSASQTQWNGEGMPPVGMEIEYKFRKVKYRNDFSRGRVLAYGVQNVFMEHWSSKNEFIQPLDNIEFRPIRSEAELKREEAVAKLIHYFFITPPKDISGEFDWESMFAVYDAIAAGKIPHIQLK